MENPVHGGFTGAFLRLTEPMVFRYRRLTLTVVLTLTTVLGGQALQLRPDASIAKQLPAGHEFTRTFHRYEGVFGGSSGVLIAISRKSGDIYDVGFLETLRKATDAAFFIPGVDRATVTSLFTPNVPFAEAQEGGTIAHGSVVPAEYEPTPAMVEVIRKNIHNSRVFGRIISDDQSAAMISLDLLETVPVTGESLDYMDVARRLEELRSRFALPGSPDYNPDVSINIVGFAKAVGDIQAASREVAGFFGVTLLLTLGLLWLYSGALRIAVLPLLCAVVAVIWELGLLRLFGFGVDPYAILVPFLILALGVSHGVQITSFWLNEVAAHRRNSHDASLATFRRLVIPGLTALLTNIAGFATLLLIPMGFVREMAINACFGCVGVIVGKKVLLPILLSYARLPDVALFRAHQSRRDAAFDRVWTWLAGITQRRRAAVVILAATALYGWAEFVARDLVIGEIRSDVSELRPDSRYNRDAAAIDRLFVSHRQITLMVFAETHADACVEHPVMEIIDRFSWHMANVPGVVGVRSLPHSAAYINGFFFEDDPKWHVLPRNRDLLVMATAGAGAKTGLANTDCSVMPVAIFLRDHRAESIDRVVAAVQAFRGNLPARSPVHFALASGNAGLAAAANHVVRSAERPMLWWVYAAIALCVWLSFRSVAAMICILAPLAVVSTLAYAVMVLLGIGLKVTTLPIAAFAAGIGVDYGIYIYSVLDECLARGLPLRDAYYRTLHQTGKAVIFTGLALTTGVSTWVFSGLQFQVDMGVLLAVLFMASMAGTVLLLPALAAFLLRHREA